jgi:HAD superfamily hydrolase (TIGR01549 family)
MEAAIFDLDGTLLDSKAMILRCFNTALRDFGYEPFMAEELYPMIGMGLAMILEKRGANRPEVINRYIELQTGTFMQDLKCFKGVPEMLVALRNSGYLIGTATMRRGAVSRVVLGGMGILEHFDAIVGADDTPEPKPSGIHILTTCQAMNVLPGSAVMVGDTKYDIMAARAAGVMAVGVTWGLGKREEMAEAGAKHIFDNVGELEKFLKCVR